VHFGFRDGISNPRIVGFHSPDTDPESKAPKLHAPGEFILGYANDEGFNPWLLLNPGPGPNPWLLPTARIDPGFFRNGSFAAFRKIEQHEGEFDRFVSARAAQLGVSDAYVRAKLAGRWDDGRVVRPDEVSAPPPAGVVDGSPQPDETLNNFDFSDDTHGRGCPFGAHIRRMNPRADPVVPFRRRPLIRRGMPYGPRFQDAPADKRGLLGLFFCASLEDQFEHLLAQWGYANPMGPDNCGDAKDPLIGRHEDARSVFDIPVRGEQPRQIDGFNSFVTTRGTLYAFYPGLSALRHIARMDAARR
jgi:deferrochelatase/peroxidase EfeB